MIMYRKWIRPFMLVVALAVFCAPNIRAATMSEVEALEKLGRTAMANTKLTKRKAMSTAISYFQMALDQLEEVEGISEEELDTKAASLSSSMFWASKFMPLSGDAPNNLPTAGPARSTTNTTRSQASPSTTAKRPSIPTVNADKKAYEQAKAFARRNPKKFSDVSVRFASVGAAYPDSTYGKKANTEANKWTRKAQAEAKRLEKIVPDLKERLKKLDLIGLLADYDNRIAKAEKDEDRNKLRHGRKEVEYLQSLKKWTTASLSKLPAKFPVEELGITGHKGAVLRRTTTEGLVLVEANKTSVTIPWTTAGAVPLVRLAAKLFKSENNPERALVVGICCVIAGEEATAFPLFEVALRGGADVTAAQEYFQRAQSGYSESSKGNLELTLKNINLEKRVRNYDKALKLLDDLIKTVAEDASLSNRYVELIQMQRKMMIKYKLAADGSDLTSTQRKLRRVFGCLDAKLDEASGRVTLFYDFTDRDQLKDWQIPAGWTWKNNKLNASKSSYIGKISTSGFSVTKIQQKKVLAWTIPAVNFEMTVQLSHGDPTAITIIAAGMMITDRRRGQDVSANRKKVRSTTFQTKGRLLFRIHQKRAYANSGFTMGVRSGFGRTGVSRLAGFDQYNFPVDKELKFDIKASNQNSYYPALWVDGQYATGTGFDPELQFGAIGIAFVKQTGTVDNVYLSAKIDMEWFNNRTRGMK